MVTGVFLRPSWRRENWHEWKRTDYLCRENAGDAKNGAPLQTERKGGPRENRREPSLSRATNGFGASTADRTQRRTERWNKNDGPPSPDRPRYNTNEEQKSEYIGTPVTGTLYEEKHLKCKTEILGSFERQIGWARG